jgi:hypothetical protein
LRAALREAAEREPVWQAEAIPLMIRIDEPGAPRPVAVLVAAGDIVLDVTMLGRLPGGGEAVADAIEAAVSAAARKVGVWPRAVQVRHVEVAEALRSRLATRDVRVALVDPLPAFQEMARSMLEELGGGRFWPPVCRVSLWSAWDLPDPRIGELFLAAADYWRAAPWKLAENLQAPRAVVPSGRVWTTCILGNAGEVYGLVLYSDRDDLFERQMIADEDDPFLDLRGRVITIDYTPAADMSSAARREARQAGWETAGRNAFPTLTTANTPGGGVTEEDVVDLIVLLRAVPAFISAHRAELMREQRTREPCDAIEWLHTETGVRFSYAGEAMIAEADLPDEADLGDTPDEIRTALARALEDFGHLSGDELIEAVNTRLHAGMHSYNEAPQEDLFGLSPLQVDRLLSAGEWIGSHPAIRLRQDIDLAELEDADMFHNVRALLARAQEMNGLPATDAGNLKVAVVTDMLGRLRMDAEVLVSMRRISKRIIEADVGPLFEARVLAELAELLERKGARFRCIDADALDDSHAGVTYARLFNACFRRLDLSFLSFTDWPSLQYQVGFTLARLGSVAKGWTTPDAILDSAVLPFALEQAPRPEITGFAGRAFESMVLQPLVDFGLLEASGGGFHDGHTERRYRVTPLYSRFFTFQS